MRKLYFLLTGFLIVNFCFSQTSISDSIKSDGIYRTYKLYIPAIYNQTNAVPLVFNLHAYSFTNSDQESYANFKPIADTANFILVLPQGLIVSQAQDHNLGWDNFNTVADANKDLNFISNLIDSIKAQYNIDLSRVYATGYSNGGFMSYDLACYLNSRIAAVASVAGSMTTLHDSLCNPENPTPIMEIHGEADSCITYNGLPAQCLTLQTIKCLHIDSLISNWVKRNNCSTSPIITNVSNSNLLDQCTAKHYVYNGGTYGNSVELFKIAGGSHTWPGSGFIWGSGTCMDFKATTEIWRFFRKYSLQSNSIYSKSIVKTDDIIKIFPNPNNGVFTINTALLPANIKILNSVGQVIKEINIQSKANFDVEINGKGIYLLHLTTASETIIKKVIVK